MLLFFLFLLHTQAHDKSLEVMTLPQLKSGMYV